ncbi:hypothetical protein BHU16_08610 [Tannerella sp. oral taxon 808]|nr:hypothetical protein BHU16_08610 [Tannerella sp. oral taxon 808]
MVMRDNIVASLHIEVPDTSAVFTHVQITECTSCRSVCNTGLASHNIMSSHEARKALRSLCGISSHVGVIPLNMYIVVSSHPNVLFTLIIDLHIIPKEDVAMYSIITIVASLRADTSSWPTGRIGGIIIPKLRFIHIGAQLDEASVIDGVVMFEGEFA